MKRIIVDVSKKVFNRICNRTNVQINKDAAIGCIGGICVSYALYCREGIWHNNTFDDSLELTLVGLFSGSVGILGGIYLPITTIAIQMWAFNYAVLATRKRMIKSIEQEKHEY